MGKFDNLKMGGLINSNILRDCKSLSFIIIIIFFMNSCKNDTVKIYLIPKGYMGPIVIIEDPKAKDLLEINNDTLQFDFRKSNILRYRGKFIEGVTSLSNLHYYYIDSLENKIELPIVYDNKSILDSNKIYVYLEFSQVRGNSQCDLISSKREFLINRQQQQNLCDSMFAIHIK
jgi:hypothetical protein